MVGYVKWFAQGWDTKSSYSQANGPLITLNSEASFRDKILLLLKIQ